TGHGQYLSCAIHDAVSKNTELDLQSWIMRHAPFYRQTCRHAGEAISPRSIGPTKDGRWLMTSPPGASAAQSASWQKLLTLLDEHGILHDLYDEPYAQVATNRELIRDRAVALHVIEVTHRLLQRYQMERVPWTEAQEAGLLWAPLRKPHENALDPHWLKRGSFGEVHNHE